MLLQRPIFKNISYLTKYNHCDNFISVCSNPGHVRIIEQLINYLDDDLWVEVCGNPYAVHIIEANIDEINNLSFYEETDSYTNKRLHAWYNICQNRNAIHIIKNNLKIIDNYIELNTSILSYIIHNSNPECIRIIHYYYDKLTKNNIKELCANPNAIELIRDRIFTTFDIDNFEYLCSNKNREAVKIIKSNFTNFINYVKPYSQFTDRCPIIKSWSNLCLNPNTVHIIKNNIEILDKYNLWRYLCRNPYAIELIETNIDKIINNSDLFMCLLSNENAIHLIEKYEHLINHWYNLCINPNAVDIIERNLLKIDKYTIENVILSQPHLIDLINKYNLIPINKSCSSIYMNENGIHLFCSYDYEKMKNNMSNFNKELCEYIFEPLRVKNYIKKHNLSAEEFSNLY